MTGEIISGAALVLVALIEAIASIDRRREKAEREKYQKVQAENTKAEEQRERAREELMILVIRSNGASIALGEATARAVQRIPDAHCNGDMHAALENAAQVKQAQQTFLEKQGITAVFN